MTTPGDTEGRGAPPAWQAWGGGAVSAALLAAIVVQMRPSADTALAILGRVTPAQWLLFAVIYLAQPLGDFAIFRRLWGLPLQGLAALLRKTAINEAVVGYGGEVYLFLWARRLQIPKPLGAVKDVAVLSALATNALTLIMLAWTSVQPAARALPPKVGALLWAAVALTAAPFALAAFGRRIFALSGRQLAFVGAAHLLRALVVNGLTVVLWTQVAPQASLSACLIVLTLRLTISRLPFIPNKELVFANAVLLVAGAWSPIAQSLASLALANGAMHVVVIAATAAPVGAWGILRRRAAEGAG